MLERGNFYKSAAFFLILFTVSNFALAKVIYVDKDANGVNTGLTWKGAQRCLQDALAQAQSGDEIRIAQGIQSPDERFQYGREKLIISSGDRTATFQLKTGVTIKGGYAGFSEPDPDVRDISLYETILSGDLDSNDVEVADPCDLLNEPARAENSYHVITGMYVDATAILDGFTVSGGNANGEYPYYCGGGMSIGDISNFPGVPLENSNPTLRNCTFKDNSSSYWGGCVFNGTESSPKFINCIFRGNFTPIFGGGIYNFSDSNPEIINCTFIENKAKNGGGCYSATNKVKFTDCLFYSNFASGDFSTGNGAGLCLLGDDAFLTNCTFVNNKATQGGGGIYNGTINMTLTNCKFVCNTAKDGAGICNVSSGSVLTCCTFCANTALEDGGAIRNYSSDTNLTNCIFISNSGEYGNALYYSSSLGVVKVNNCILWDGGNEIYHNFDSNITVTYSDVKGGWSGLGNINTDPLFAIEGYWDSNGTPDDSSDDLWIEGDYHLKSHAGRFDINTQSWVQDDVMSPCIDTGDPLTPIGHEPYPNGSRINMGVYGSSEQASMSLNDTRYFHQASDPYPADNAVDTGLEEVLTWASDANAVAQEIYFGVSHFPPFIEKFYENTYDPGVLLPNTRYYWRVDNTDSMINRSVGDTWTFLTGPTPVTAYNPSPDDGSEGIWPDTSLSWNPGLDASYHTVYFGTDFNDVSNASYANFFGVYVSMEQDSNYYMPDNLDFNKTYYWRIDEEDSVYNITRGSVWTFKTFEISYKALKPNPSNGAIDVSVGITSLLEPQELSWFPGINAVKHDVYLGTDFNDVNNATIANPLNVLVSMGQEPNFYQPDSYEYSQLYYWRIDETDSNGITTKGDVWAFITEAHAPKVRGCFTGQMPVWIDGKTVAISKAVTGMETSINEKIEQVQAHEGTWTLYDVLLDSGNRITVADDHYFLTESGKWLSLHNLAVGMKLKTSKEPVEIKSITKNPVPFTGKVYNLKIKGSNQYMVGNDAVIVSDY